MKELWRRVDRPPLWMTILLTTVTGIGMLFLGRATQANADLDRVLVAQYEIRGSLDELTKTVAYELHGATAKAPAILKVNP